MCGRGVLSFVERQLPPERIAGRRVLEVGSLDINGSARQLLTRHRPALYLGIDIRHGPGVDLVLDVGDAPVRLGTASFDAVVCTEVLEHLREWGAALVAMKDVLRPGGTLVVTTRSPGFPLHDFPHDYWRFTTEDLDAAFADLDAVVIEEDPDSPGVFGCGTRPGRNVEQACLGTIRPQLAPGGAPPAEPQMDPDGETPPSPVLPIRRPPRAITAAKRLVADLRTSQGRTRLRDDLGAAETTLLGFDERFRLPPDARTLQRAAFRARRQRLARRVNTHSATVEPWFAPESALTVPPPPLTRELQEMTPTFVGIGSSKSGTTWWYELLAAHPRWAKRPPSRHSKELLYFDQFLTRPYTPLDAARYRAHFRRRHDELLGEWTPIYMDAPWTAPMLAEAVTDASLLVMVRDPVERALSDLRFQVPRYGHDFNTLHLLEAARRSSYWQLLQPWLAVFPREQIQLLQYERCRQDPAGELARTWALLAVDDPSPIQRDVLVREHVFHPGTMTIPSTTRERLRTMLAPDARALAAEFPDRIDSGLWPTLID